MSTKMNQETAKKLFAEGAIFVLLGVPEGTEFGIDMKSWNTGEKFRGVKMIPPGIHYIFYSGVGDMGDVAPRVGFFYNFRKSEMLVKKWDKDKEDISDEIVEENEVVRLKENIEALDKFLGPYPYDILNKWNSLTSHITVQLIDRLSPSSGKIRSALELLSCKDVDRPRFDKNSPGPSNSKISKRTRLSQSEESEDEFLPHLKPQEGTELRITQFPERNYPENASASEITRHSLDSSYVLDLMISKYISQIDILGEIEFCYICFLVGHSLEAFEHWKKLVGLLCSCELAIKKYRGIYDAFISILEVQIKEIPEEFLADIVSNNNFVYIKLRNLFRAVMESEVDGQFKAKAMRFKEDLTEIYLWDFSHLDSEDEEDAPVIVDVQVQ